MKKGLKRICFIFALVIMMLAIALPVFAAGEAEAAESAVVGAEAAVEETKNSVIGDKALAAAITISLAAAAGAVGMGWAIAKSVEGIARQPEAEGKIRTTLMLGLVFVETAIIYALVVAILIIFVL